MPIRIECTCGKSFQVKDEMAGRKGRCPGCKGPLVVPRPAAVEEVDALDLILIDDAPKRTTPPPLPVDTSVQREPRPAPRPAPRRAATPPDLPRESRPRTKGSRVRREGRNRSRGPLVSPMVWTGLLMIFGAVAWFVLGIVLMDRIFFYPPILFVLGIVSIVKGALGHEQ